MTCRELIEKLNRFCPPEYAMSWDNSGLVAGDADNELNTVYIALDATDKVIGDAAAAGADLLLTHHPLVFSAMKKINTDDFTGRRLIRLIENRLCCFAMHTNFDAAYMADIAADKMGLSDCEVLQPTDIIFKDGDEISIGIGKAGTLKAPVTLKEYAADIKKIFHLDTVSVFGDLNVKISKAAVCPGSGKSTINDAVKKGAQVLVTGDIGHHEGLDAVACGLNIIDAGHQGLEKIFIDFMAAHLRENFPELKIVTENSKSPFTVM